MNKAELIEFVAKEVDSTKADAQRAVEAVFKGITTVSYTHLTLPTKRIV